MGKQTLIVRHGNMSALSALNIKYGNVHAKKNNNIIKYKSSWMTKTSSDTSALHKTFGNRLYKIYMY